MAAVALGQKILSRTRVQGSLNLTEICFSTHLETIRTTVKEVNSDRTKALDEFIFRSASLVCFNTELDE